MAMKVSPFAGKPAEPSMLVNVPKLITAYYTESRDSSGLEQIYKIYAESFRGEDHLSRILEEAQTIVTDALEAATVRHNSTA
jgi:hypothetical protein